MGIFKRFFDNKNTKIKMDGVNNSSIQINGSNYVCSGDLTIIGDKVYVDGKEVTEGLENKKPIHITIQGDTGPIEVGHCDSLTIGGVVNGDVKTMSGDIEIEGDAKNIKSTSGDISCGKVSGDVTTVSGDVTCTEVGGNINTVSGDITSWVEN